MKLDMEATLGPLHKKSPSQLARILRSDGEDSNSLIVSYMEAIKQFDRRRYFKIRTSFMKIFNC